MKFTVDENLPTELVSDWIAAGHEAETVVDGPSEVLRFVQDHLSEVIQRELKGIGLR